MGFVGRLSGAAAQPEIGAGTPGLSAGSPFCLATIYCSANSARHVDEYLLRCSVHLAVEGLLEVLDAHDAVEEGLDGDGAGEDTLHGAQQVVVAGAEDLRLLVHDVLRVHRGRVLVQRRKADGRPRPWRVLPDNRPAAETPCGPGLS